MSKQLIKRISVFCGSNTGRHPIFEQQAYQLGQILAQQNIELVYGGANVGLMGAVANGALAHGGRVIGILPHFLREKELAHEHLTELILVDTMHKRKTKMNDLSDGVIALPGGMGTLEELFEMLTWGQLGLHKKPIAILNVAGYYNSLKTLIQTMVNESFLKEIYQQMLIISDDIEDVLTQMQHYEAPNVKKWIPKEAT